MDELILAFFAVLGITFLGVNLFEVFYYRKRKYKLPLIVDLTQKDQDEAWEILESIAIAKKYSIGKSLIGDVFLLTSKENPATSEEKMSLYLHTFDLPGVVFTKDEEWCALFQNISEKEGI